MKLSKLIDELELLLAQHGDKDVLINPCLGTGTLHAVDQVDLEVDDDRLIIWAGESVE